MRIVCRGIPWRQEGSLDFGQVGTTVCRKIPRSNCCVINLPSLLNLGSIRSPRFTVSNTCLVTHFISFVAPIVTAPIILLNSLTGFTTCHEGSLCWVPVPAATICDCHERTFCYVGISSTKILNVGASRETCPFRSCRVHVLKAHELRELPHVVLTCMEIRRYQPIKRFRK